MILGKCEHSTGRTVTLRGDLSLTRGRELRELLLKALREGGEAVLEFSEYTGADLSFLQLLCAAHRTAVRMGSSLRLGSSMPREFFETARAAGYLRDKCCTYSNDESCLWLRRGIGEGKAINSDTSCVCAMADAASPQTRQGSAKKNSSQGSAR